MRCETTRNCSALWLATSEGNALINMALITAGDNHNHSSNRKNAGITAHNPTIIP